MNYGSIPSFLLAFFVSACNRARPRRTFATMFPAVYMYSRVDVHQTDYGVLEVLREEAIVLAWVAGDSDGSSRAAVGRCVRRLLEKRAHLSYHYGVGWGLQTTYGWYVMAWVAGDSR